MAKWRCCSTILDLGIRWKWASRPGRFSHDTHWIRCWLDPSANKCISRWDGGPQSFPGQPRTQEFMRVSYILKCINIWFKDCLLYSCYYQQTQSYLCIDLPIVSYNKLTLIRYDYEQQIVNKVSQDGRGPFYWFWSLAGRTRKPTEHFGQLVLWPWYKLKISRTRSTTPMHCNQWLNVDGIVQKITLHKCIQLELHIYVCYRFHICVIHSHI
jgi:hypothetical protein